MASNMQTEIQGAPGTRRPQRTTKREVGKLLVEIGARCKKAGIEFEPPELSEEIGRLSVRLPAGRDKRELVVEDELSARSLLKIPFEKVHGVSGFRAYCSYDEGFIEALLDTGRRLGFGYPTVVVLDRLRRALRRPEPGEEGEKNEREDTSRIELKSDDERFQEIILTIGPATETFAILESLRMRRSFALRERETLYRPLTIRIDGIPISRDDQAISILEGVANSALFQIDLLVGLPMYVAIGEEQTRYPRRGASREEVKLTFPKFQYDSKPMSLYWYARTGTGMPLLQYLAYYQVIEFYFPVFAEKATHQIAQRMLKDPTFDANREVDITQLLGALRPFQSKGGYGDERAALGATLRECLSEQELRTFLAEDNVRLGFFKSNEAQSIASTRIPVERENADLISETANRIYEIRCKIVHTKASDASRQITDLLLPFSKEAQQLGFDIEVVEFVARKVLIASGRPLVL